MSIADDELNAMKKIMKILDDMEIHKRERVLAYIMHRSDDWRTVREPSAAAKPRTPQSAPGTLPFE